jgi:hypothetical protein
MEWIKIGNPEDNHDFGDAPLEEIKRVKQILDILRLLNRQIPPQPIYESCIRILNREIPLVVRDDQLSLIPRQYHLMGRNQE